MAENLEFVPTLGTDNELLPLINVEPGTHTDCIFKESLRPLTKYADFFCYTPQSPFVLATSFPDILPHVGKMLLNKANSIFVRGEFLALRVIGSKMTKLPLKGKDFEAINKITETIANNSPEVIYYRLMDYNPDEFTFLGHNTSELIRGSARLLKDKNLLEHELYIVRLFKKYGKKVRIILPHITSPKE